MLIITRNSSNIKPNGRESGFLCISKNANFNMCTILIVFFLCFNK